ncbi:MAG TPA: NAD(P)H-hydrate dehydratase [archaeon]|nr:NAD(P)H-hydrate dehydratase [archaeon]
MEFSEVKGSILKQVYKKRDPWSRKYDFGHLLVIGGSKRYSGSPAFNSMAALRAGVDLVTVVAPERAANIVASFSPNMIAYPLSGDYIEHAHLSKLIDFTKDKTAVVIGGGLTRWRGVIKTVLEYLKKVDIPVVVDADAIHAVATNKDILKNKKIVLTPHAHEFEVLSGIKPTTDLNQRIKMVQDVAGLANVTILLKGSIDIISDGNKIAINKTGSPYMTKGGLGDTLAGICGALLARGNDCFTSACAAAYINGKAGEIAAKKMRESLVATDLIDAIPEVIRI